MHACYDCEYDLTENEGLGKTNGSNRLVVFFPIPYYYCCHCRYLQYIFPVRTGHEKAKCEKLFPEQDFPV